MSLSIREAVPEDYEELSRLVIDAYREFAETLGDDWEGYREDLADIAGRATQGRQLVAEIEGRPVGTVSYYPPRGEAGANEWWWWPKGFAYVRALGVDPAIRGRGVGRALTIACIERARADGAAGITLNTLSFMPAATALYEGLGFHQTGDDGEWGGGKLLSYTQNIEQIS
ncbi:MAG TPA: GNAT family N-acetyltransferase [Actinomycetota bacterium]